MWCKSARINDRRFTTQFENAPVEGLLFNDVRLSWLWLVLRLWLGWKWLEAGWGKVQNPAWTGPNAGGAIQGFVNGAISKTGGEHPDVPGWYAAFLQNVVLPNASLWSHLVAYGEVLVGIALVLGLFTGIAAFFGGFMNFNYLLAGTVSTNPMMFLVGALLMLAWKTAGWLGLDRVVLPLLGTPWAPGKFFRGDPALGRPREPERTERNDPLQAHPATDRRRAASLLAAARFDPSRRGIRVAREHCTSAQRRGPAAAVTGASYATPLSAPSSGPSSLPSCPWSVLAAPRPSAPTAPRRRRPRRGRDPARTPPPDAAAPPLAQRVAPIANPRRPARLACAVFRAGLGRPGRVPARPDHPSRRHWTDSEERANTVSAWRSTTA